MSSVVRGLMRRPPCIDRLRLLYIGRATFIVGADVKFPEGVKSTSAESHFAVGFVLLSAEIKMSNSLFYS